MSDTKCVFRWTDMCKVNVALLDQQPQGLFDTFNELERALRVGEGNAVIDGILDRLVTYAGLHSASEESLMKKHSFPRLPTHRIQHEMFRNKMATLLDRHRNAKAG
jgi:hemerythrin